MRIRPVNFDKALGAQWLCAAMDQLLGECDLATAPALMSGFGSVLDSAAAARFAPAAFALRQLGVAAASEGQLRQLVYAAANWEEDHRLRSDYVEPPYDIDVEHPRFAFRRRVPADDPSLAKMITAMTNGLQFASQAASYADPARPAFIVTAEAVGAARIAVDLSELGDLPPPPQFDAQRKPRGPIQIPIVELETMAAELDVRDAAAPSRPPGNWHSRLREATGEAKFQVLAADRASGELVETDSIRLDGVAHLIGLPGTGKTTLIVLILLWLNRHDYRAVVLLPSIETSLNLLADLEFYGADVGLLVGQSPQTRIEHARKFAERLGSDDSRGFGRSDRGARLLALNCALAGFDSEDRAEAVFPHLSPPCTNLNQRSEKASGKLSPSETPHLCPLAGVCGRLTAPRELSQRKIWLGHVLSLDTRLSPHFSQDSLRYFEAVAMTADLVVVDEADGAQATLDRKAIASLDLTGSEASYEHALNQDLFLPLSAGRNNMTAASIQQYSSSAADFRKLNHSLVTQLQRLRIEQGPETPLSRFEDTFVTGNNVLTALFSVADISTLPPSASLSEERRFNAIRAFWDGVVRQALFRRTDIDDDLDGYGFEAAQVGRDLDRSADDVTAAALSLAALLRNWISEPAPRRRDALLDQAKEILFALIPPAEHTRPPEQAELFRFLVCVTTVIMQFLNLVTSQQTMVTEGIHQAPLFRQGISEDLARLVPEALIGQLSGVRYYYEGEENGRRSVRLQYVAFRGAPRILLYQLHQMFRHEGRGRGPNVLLASATSFLAESPTFHIPIGPDLVLRRAAADEGWKDSRYIFAPIRDPDQPSKVLRFSGAPLASRERVLRKMIDHYFRGETPLFQQMLEDFDPGRRVGFVVNSYAQVRQFKEHLRRNFPHLNSRVIGVIDTPPAGNEGDWITAAQIERLGERTSWDAIVFPMKALARGVNIVFTSGPRQRDALLGTLVFLLRPHPAAESLDLVAGIAGRATLNFDQTEFSSSDSIHDLNRAWRTARRELNVMTRRLLRFPIQASRLGPLWVPFTADIMVDVLQTIGRTMRNGCKARVIFADAAWAPRSAIEKAPPDTAQTSMIVAMRDILQARVSDANPIDRAVYGALYSPFLAPLTACGNVRFPETGGAYDD